MYHLRYLDSVDNRLHKIKYKYQRINLIFDEIELYYHPEFQRNFIQDFLFAVERCNLNTIKNINCVFITHSPFILSDIPNSNILFLDKGEQKSTSTESFAANIHDMLAKKFFMENGLIGEFAKKTLEDLISFLTSQKSDRSYSRKESLAIVELVSDRVIRDRMFDLYFAKFGIDKESLERRRGELEMELGRINEELEYD